MRKYGIDTQVLSMPAPGPDRFGSNVTAKICRLLNDEVAKICERERDNYIGLASIPFGRPEDAKDELIRAIKDLGLKGVSAYNNINGKYLDAKSFQPIFRTVESLGVPVYVHPTVPVAGKVTGAEYNLNMIFGWPFDTSISMGRVIFSDLLGRFPNLKFIYSHAGGMFPFFWNRVTELQEAHLRELSGVSLKKTPEEYLRKMYVDLAVYGNLPAAMCTLDLYSANNCLFASDYPFGTKGGLGLVELATDMIKKLDISTEDKKKVLADNARRLLRL